MADPEFTDTARAALMWVLWHHQGGSSPTGQAVRFALGMGQFDRMTADQVAQAKTWAPGIPGLAHTDRAGGSAGQQPAFVAGPGFPVSGVSTWRTGGPDGALVRICEANNNADCARGCNVGPCRYAPQHTPAGVKTVDGGQR